MLARTRTPLLSRQPWFSRTPSPLTARARSREGGQGQEHQHGEHRGRRIGRGRGTLCDDAMGLPMQSASVCRRPEEDDCRACTPPTARPHIAGQTHGHRCRAWMSGVETR